MTDMFAGRSLPLAAGNRPLTEKRFTSREKLLKWHCNNEAARLHNAGADMKIRVEIDSQAQTDEVIIRCKSLTDEVAQIQKAVSDLIAEKKRIVFYKRDAEYYFPLEEILFFETDADGICAHTKDNIYKIHYRLYELEELLPGYFIRISKSAILNIRKIYAIDRNLSSASIVSFQNTYKKVYVSRRYYKPLKDRLEERG